MSNNPDFEKDLAAIRNLMERSSRFISFSGLAGILAGVYALAGCAIAFVRVPPTGEQGSFLLGDFQKPGAIPELVTIAALVLVASLLTGFIVTGRRAQRLGVNMFDEAGRRTLFNLSIPLVAGGVFILVLLSSGQFGLVAACCLIFYGLALIQASPNLFDEVRYLGYLEIALGLIAAAVPGYGLYLWAIGFGVLHIIYGAVLFRKYEA